MKFDKFKFIGGLILVCITIFSCDYTKKDAERYLPGRYTYEIPSGELQELIVNKDFTFKQVLYSKNKKAVLYENMGKMSVAGEDIVFDHWLECYELEEQKLLLKPYITSDHGSYWRKPEGDEGVLIVIFEESGYIFRKKNIPPALLSVPLSRDSGKLCNKRSLAKECRALTVTQKRLINIGGSDRLFTKMGK